MRVLVLSAHPDDETIGAGGVIASLARDGCDVFAWIATEVYEPHWKADERDLRAGQARDAARILGIKEVRFGGFKTMNLSATPTIELSRAVAALVADISPDILLAPPPSDINTDHATLFDAALVAARGLPETPIRAFYAYEIATTSCFLPPERAFPANTYVDITETFERKIEALAAYKSETRDFPHPRSREGLEILARERGLACGARYAEAFMLVSRRFGQKEAPLL